jgi:hypothetical protein
VKVLALRRADVCVGCSAALPVGSQAGWDAASRTVRCLACAGALFTDVTAQLVTTGVREEPSAAVDQRLLPDVRLAVGNVGGASAQREYERRSQRREQRIRSKHPRLAGLILALNSEPVSTRVWAQGADGERAVAAKLDELAGEHVAVLHDRAMRRPDGRPSRANIDHIAVAASGVWVIDAKTHHGSLQVRRSGGIFSARVEKLFIAGRDKTSLLEGLAKQVTAVTTELAAVDANVPVRGVLCFVGTERPWFGETIAGIPLVGRRGLGKLLKAAGDLTAQDRADLAEFLATRFAVAP